MAGGADDEIGVSVPVEVPGRPHFPGGFLAPLTADPQLAVQMCRSLLELDPNTSSSSPDGVVCGGGDCPFFDIPEGAKVTCGADGRTFTYEKCPQKGALCARNGCSTGGGSWPPGKPRPQGWPCP